MNGSEIEKSLLKLHHFPELQLKRFNECLIHAKLKKKERILQPNQISSGISFVHSGCLRFYTLREGREWTVSFFTENSWATDLESLLTQQVSTNYLEAIENSVISSISLKDLHTLMDLYPAFRMLHALLSESAISTKQLMAIQTKSPDERYKELLLQQPEWIKRFPQMHLASYLGMTPETLSRVRARLL